ncbi:unnamed protein product [Cuscuta epithymum]|uniref:Uncharacterized protein n=1 Tax=Cuscuta epithymum TaxID=186058 RepID=A0AAV0DSA9_9ASTE|nr:unnamed protein product [Cuscuta epithymum]CAH9142018.1 unnamed protein product [Cuscuta epithymum]
MALNPGAFATQAPLQPYFGGNIVHFPPPPPLFGNPVMPVGNAEGVVAQDTASQEAQSKDKRPMNKEKPRTSALERLGAAPDRLGGKAISRPQESGGSFSGAEERPPPRDKGKPPLHPEDARHQINNAQSFRANSQGVDPKDPKDEISEALLRQLEEARQAPPADPALQHNYSFSLQVPFGKRSGGLLMEYMTQEPPTHRLLLLLHKPTEPREHLRPKDNGPSLKGAQNTHWGAFGLLGRRLQITQGSQVWAYKATGRNDVKGVAFGYPEPSAPTVPSALEGSSTSSGLRLHQALGRRGSLRPTALSSKIPFGDSQPPHLMRRHIHPPHLMR